jgi:hypothetical protein
MIQPINRIPLYKINVHIKEFFKVMVGTDTPTLGSTSNLAKMIEKRKRFQAQTIQEGRNMHRPVKDDSTHAPRWSESRECPLLASKLTGRCFEHP